MMGEKHCGKVIKDDYIFKLTDDTGMLQHSKYGIPDPRHGYTTDDNARALIMALMLYGRYGKKKYLDLIYRYASFLLNAQNENGKFKNFMSYDRRWLEDEGSEDCFGRCIWALGFAVSNKNTPQVIKDGLRHSLSAAVPHAAALVWPRAKAYSVIGLSISKEENAADIIFELAKSLCGQYFAHRDGEWKWFENKVSYCNNVLPWALFAAYKITKEPEFLDVAEESLKFLEELTFKEGYFKPVGCDGWFLKGGVRADYDEQTVEACEGVLAYLEAYKTTGKKEYLLKAKKCHAWYEGDNSKGISLIDCETGGCRDGLTRLGVNLNMGAESLVSYVISNIKISEIDEDESETR